MNIAIETLKYFNIMLKIQKQLTLNADIDTNLATTFHKICGCLMQMNRAKEALEEVLSSH